jgi:hypothetical protein
VLTPAFELVATSKAPLSEAAPGFIRFYGEFVRSFGAQLTTYATGTMTSWKKPTAKALQMLPSWLSESRNLELGGFGIEFHSGPSVVELVPPAIRIDVDNGASYISVSLPPDFVATDPQRALTFLKNAIGGDFALAAGWAGYAIAWNTSMGDLTGEPAQTLGAWLKRHPGLGHGNNFNIYDRALHGISSVNWLTLLGPELTARKGGRDAIAAGLGDEITVGELSRGVCIQAGPQPLLGDVNRGDDLPLYRRVGRFLADVRTHEPFRILSGLDDPEAWFARFDS